MTDEAVFTGFERETERLLVEISDMSPSEILIFMEKLEERDPEAAEGFRKGVVNIGLAQNYDHPVGFQAFYELVYDRRVPVHAYFEWILPIYLSMGGLAEEEWQELYDEYCKYAEGAGIDAKTVEQFEYGVEKGLVIQAFRGSTKTTTLTVAFAAFKIGHQPEKSNLLIQVGDGVAKDNSQEVADIIAYNPGWKAVFPNVVPDEVAGWGADGYVVKDTRIEYGAWKRKRSKASGKDPTFIGLGYKSRAIIGKHPTGLLIFDDIHDDNNTISMRELEKVRRIVTGTILPTAVPGTWKIGVGTPWNLNDVLAYLVGTGRYNLVKTPVMREKPNVYAMLDLGNGYGEAWEIEAIHYNTVQGDVQQLYSIWPELRQRDWVEDARQEWGELEFARMFLLDLTAAEGINLKAEWLTEYPAEKIDKSWPMVMGVDYASTADNLPAGTDRDYFAVGFARLIPGGKLVITGGFRGRVSQGEAEEKMKALYKIYPQTQLIGVEAIGKGEEFFHLLIRTTTLPVMPYSTGGKRKGHRFEKGMAPLFQFNRVYISDEPNEFLNVFRKEWVQWPNGEHDDTLDAVYWAIVAGRGNVMAGDPDKNIDPDNPFKKILNDENFRGYGRKL